MSDKEKERRRAQRAKKNFFLQFRKFGTTSSWSTAILRDVSEGGVSFSAAGREFNTEDKLDIRISTFLREQPICLIGRIVGIDGKKVGVFASRTPE